MGVFSTPGVAFPRSPSPIILLKSAIPIMSPSTCTMGDNGAFTAMTAQATTYSGGAWVYWPVHAFSASVPAAAGFYWTVFSSTTAGTAYNNIMPSTGFPTPPSTLVPFVTTGTGSIVGNTSATALLTIPLMGGLLGNNGMIRITMSSTNNNSAGTKTFGVKVGTGSAPAVAPTTGTQLMGFITFVNVNSQSINKAMASYGASGTGVTSYLAIDTSQTQNITFNITNNTATDNFVLEDVLIELIADGT